MATAIKQNATGNPEIDPLLIGSKWSGVVTYSFTDSAADYPSNYALSGYFSTLQVISAQQQAGFQYAFALIESYTNLTFSFAGSGTSDIRIAQTSSSALGTARVADFPGGGAAGEGGDIWFGTAFNYRAATHGNYAFATLIHELGHAVGLRHAHQIGAPGVGTSALPSAHDWMGYSIMSYRSYQNGPTTGYTNETWGYASTFMANDILALQTMYGADYTTNSGNTVYTWSATTGAYMINGATQFTPGGNRVFMTVWDGGGVDTYDLSTYTQSLQLNLTPGGYSATGANQRVNLGGGAFSPGNIFNAYLFGNDTRSLIENAIGGTANDTIQGNQGANRLEGRGGADTLTGLAGDDVLVGGAGDDTMDGGTESDTVVIEANRSAVTVTFNTTTQRFTLTSATTGTDTVANVEFFQFNDVLLSAASLQSTDSVAPTLSSTAPSDNATGVAPSANLVLTFSEQVIAGTGNITIFNSAGTVIATISVTDTTQVTFSGSVMTINPTADLAANGSYYVNIASGAVRDLAGNTFAGITGNTAFNFSTAAAADTTAPTITSLSPSDGATNVAASANIVMTFSESVQAGTGNIVIFDSNGVAVHTISVTDATRVTIAGNTVTINPSTDLTPGGSYYVNLASGVLRDLAGNAFAGIAGNTAYNFTVAGAGGVDDYTNNTATTGNITVNGSAVTGNIEVGADTDWFRVTLVAGQRYEFSAVGSGTKPLTDTYLTLRDSAGNIIAVDDDGGDGFNSLLVYNALTSGTYYLEVRHYDTTSTGTYTLSARFAETTPPTLVSTTPADNTANVVPYADLVFTFSESVQAGVGNITVYRSDGSVAAQVAAGDFSQVLFAGSTMRVDLAANLAPGSYYVNIDAGAVRDLVNNPFGGLTGSTAFNFSVVVAPDDFAATIATTGILAINGATVSGAIETTGDLDWFRVDLSAGVEYTFTLASSDINPLGDPHLFLRNSAGVSLIDNDDGGAGLDSLIIFTPTTSGTYYLEARHHGTETGNYIMAARSPDAVAPTLNSATPSDNSVGVAPASNFVLTFSEAVRAGVGDVTIFNADGSVARRISIADTSQVSFSGTTVTINPTFDLGTGSNYYINIDSGAIVDIAGNGYGGISGNTAWNFTTGGSADDYPLSTATGGVVAIGGPPTTGNIETANDGDAFRLTLTAGHTYTFTMTGTPGAGGLVDPYLELRDATGAFITYNDDFNGLNSQITFTASSSGTYFLYAYAYSTGTGTYSLAATTSGADTAAPLITAFYPPDNSTNLSPSVGIYVLFNESIVAGSGAITLYNADGTAARTISVTDTSQVSVFGSTLFIAPAADLTPGGSYYLNIAAGAIRDTAGNSFAGVSGTTVYNFTVSNAIDDYPFSLITPGFVAVNSPATAGVIESLGDIDLFRVTLVAGATYVFTLNSQAGGLDDPYLELYGPGGAFITANDDFSGLNSQITYTATASGTFFLGASAFSTGTGGYLLAATSTTNDATAPTYVSGVPADNATGVDFNANLVLTFSEAMRAGTGNIIIYNANGTVARTISVADTTQVSFSGETVIINPTASLGAGRGYYVNFGAGVLRDLNGNNFAGFTTTAQYDFTTGAITGTANNDTLAGGPAEDTINALGGDDSVSGLGGDDAINGGEGNDVIDGGTGADQMIGGAGHDRYFVDNLGDTILELANEGVDEVVVAGDWTLGANLDLLTLIGTGFRGVGNDLANAITGNNNNNQLEGLANNDRLVGLGGDDLLDGGTGADEMIGGAGNDRYLIDNLGDTVVENANEGVDEIVSAADWTLSNNVETLTLTGAAIRGTGNGVANAITGTDAGNLLEGLGSNDRLVGLGGDDILDGGAGADEMIGGTGADRYFVDNLGDTTVENANEGVDEAVVNGDWTLGANVELLTLTGTGTRGTGNDLANAIVGTSNGNILEGLGGNDRLTGLGGGDILDGGTGADEMIGGTGDDRYFIDNLGDTVVELADEGIDEVIVFGDWTLGANIELLTLAGSGFRGTGNAVANAITGTANNNILEGLGGADRLIGLAGQDVLDGGADGDQMFGGADNDRYIVDNVGDQTNESFNEGAADETWSSIDWTLSANVEHLTLTGSAVRGSGNELNNIILGNNTGNLLEGFAGNDVLTGVGGDDILDGGAGADQMTGGTGGDRYFVDNLGDVIVENANEGIDEVVVAGDWTLGANLELLTLTGGGIRGTGNELANAIVGTSASNLLEGQGGNDRLTGLGGADILNGGTGADEMIGGQASDRYFVENAGDTTVEAANEGTDEVISTIDWTLSANMELLYLSGAALRGTGNEVANAIDGTNAGNLLEGMGGDDRLTGLGGDDVLDGGTGGDQMIGGVGNDRYIVDNIADQLTENANEGVDEVVVFGDWTLAANFETLSLAGTGFRGTGNAAANTINGTNNGNLLEGGGGDDHLFGLLGDDALDGGAGADEMVGGGGNDRYFVDNIGDTITEALGEGVDEVVVNGDWTLGANLELLTLTGTGFRGTGNGLANAILGTAGANLLQGLGANDRLTALGGDDVLDGGEGADEMIGGLGNDHYIIDNLGDVVVELSGEGVDEIVVFGDWTLGDHIELLTLAGTGFRGTGNSVNNAILGTNSANLLEGMDGDDRLTGLGGDDTLNGGAGGDDMIGGAGNDTYLVNSSGDLVTENLNEGTDEVVSSVDWTLGANVERLTLTGPAIRGTGNELANIIVGAANGNLLEGAGGDDVLNGLDGGDVLDGGSGADTMTGGLGGDRYVVDNLGDVIVENFDEGIDEIVAFGDWTLNDNVELLTLAGSGFRGVGNAVNNAIDGTASNNQLEGMAGDDRLTGLGGDDILIGGDGADQMIGGTGHDRYYVDNAGDTTVEAFDEGVDEVVSSVSFMLATNTELLTLSGIGDISGTGNAVNNAIVGNDGANTINGMGGDDRLTGGFGDDHFVFGPGSGLDQITDFVAGGTEDELDLSAYGGTGITWTITQVGADTVFTFSNGDVITLLNVTATNLVEIDPWHYG